MVVAAGIRGLLNFAPVSLQVPESVFADRLDIGAALDKIAYFADCRCKAATQAIPGAES